MTTNKLFLLTLLATVAPALGMEKEISNLAIEKTEQSEGHFKPETNELIEEISNIITPEESRKRNQLDQEMVTAIWKNEIDIATESLEKGADPNTLNSEGWSSKTALGWSARNRNIEAATTLLKKGANSKGTMKNGNSALHLACKKPKNLEMVKILVKEGADINAKGKKGSTPLLCACEKNNLDIISFLIDQGANVNACNSYQTTPLHRAVGKNYPEIVKVLLLAGADKNAKNNLKQTPLDIAKKLHLDEIINILQNAQQIKRITE